LFFSWSSYSSHFTHTSPKSQKPSFRADLTFCRDALALAAKTAKATNNTNVLMAVMSAY
jgi:hypothetical protein